LETEREFYADMKKVVALVVGIVATGVVGATSAVAAGPSACASVSAQVTVNGSDVVNQAVTQCAP
jgi:hypothetical protein